MADLKKADELEQVSRTIAYQNDPLDDEQILASPYASLDVAKRETVTEFAEVTKENVNTAIQILEGCDWDLLEAVGQFFGEDQEDNEDDPIPTIEPIRTSKPREVRPVKAHETTLRKLALNRTTTMNGKESPRNTRAAILDPIELEYTTSPVTTQSLPMFKSPYPEKMWYTGFMRP